MWETLLEKYRKWLIVGAAIVVALLVFWMSWTIRGCAYDAQVEQLVSSMQSQQAESTKLLQSQSNQLSTMTTNIISYQKTVTEQFAVAQEELNRMLDKIESDREMMLDEIAEEVGGQLTAHTLELRNYYDRLLDNPASIGPDFDNWTTVTPEYWDGPTSGDISP